MNNKNSEFSLDKNTDYRITIEALKYYVPIFHEADNAYQELLDGVLDSHRRLFLQNKAKLRELVIDKIAFLSGPLITSELNKIIANSHLRNQENIFDILYFAGLDGMKKGLRHFDVEKLNKSSTNYLFQWITTYAKKELSVLEAPFGIAPSRFRKYKKISAIRKKLSTELNREVTNEEIYDFLQSGKADLKNKNGRIGSSDVPSQANRNITIELIEEQDNYEKTLSNVSLLDPLDDYSADIKFSTRDKIPFDETIFGAFLEMYDFTEEAKIVLKAQVNKNVSSDILNSIGEKRYKELSRMWNKLLKDKNGIFYSFLVRIRDDNFTQFDVNKIISFIENNKKVNSSKYSILFKNKGEK